MTHDLTKALIAKRVQVGATSPIGRRMSMVVEQLANGVSPVQTIKEIRRLQQDGGKFVYENHAVFSRMPTQPSLVPYQQGVTREEPQIQRDGGQYVHGNHGAQR